ncbi:hypothetical protein EKO29_10410 [Colwellia sp. Arc7-635]|uniref:hypothetical protein n=1 Tax=Colwellia sp. Arc7-635 TaxID=2497879 RepID=UPI000F853448|nr:hypothetical protein [Colwellia sp. Arc7-635]AZQ84394.1 hypothetical protein EKO29_10410 [Colwellia sp. Arc7-635]
MTIAHIEALRDKLSKHKWSVDEELTGDDYSISAVWKLSRFYGSSHIYIEFEGLGDFAVLPLNEAYACHLQGDNSFSLYFGKLFKTFDAELDEFIAQLNGMQT